MRSVAIITGPETHLDHLGILSSILNIPLIVTEEKTFHFAKQFYPDLKVELYDLSELSIEFLASNYDVIFQTGKFWAAELRPFIELLFRKKMRFVFCPHGNSDKGHSLQNHVEQDVSLVYGDHLHRLLEQTEAAQKIQHIVRTGNYRYPYYLRHRIFYDTLAEDQVFSRFKSSNPILLYAPTWNDQENPTSFFSSVDALIEQLSPDFNMVIKLHPFLIEDCPAQIVQILSHYENHPSAKILDHFPPIYPLLNRCSLYLGDYSSIGYDFLIFDKPLYFLNPKKSSFSSPLHSCGLEIPQNLYRNDLNNRDVVDSQRMIIDDKQGASQKSHTKPTQVKTDSTGCFGLRVKLNQFLTETWELNNKSYSSQRKKVYLHAFGEELDPNTIKSEIFKTLQQ